MDRPRKFKLLDLFCGAGGCSAGYARAGGFDVHGCDRAAQKRYPFGFVQMDWREYLDAYGHLFDAFHASPPCQAHTVLSALHRSRGPDYDKRHEDLIEPVRAALMATGKPYVIENVQGAQRKMLAPVMLCGTMFGLQTECGAQLQRHRLFETNWLCLVPMKCCHGKRSIGVTGTGNALAGGRSVIGVYGGHARDRGEEQRTICVTGKTPWSGTNAGRTIDVHGRPQLIDDRRRVVTVTGHSAQQNVVKNQVRQTYSVEQARQAMGIDWMTQAELSQAIPPAYTEYVGRQLHDYLTRA